MLVNGNADTCLMKRLSTFKFLTIVFYIVFSLLSCTSTVDYLSKILILKVQQKGNWRVALVNWCEIYLVIPPEVL